MKLVDTISSVLRQKGGDIYHVTPSHSVYDAIEMMADKHVGAEVDSPSPIPSPMTITKDGSPFSTGKA